MRIWIVVLPAIAGASTRHNTESSARREIRNAERKGLGQGAYAKSVYVTLPICA